MATKRTKIEACSCDELCQWLRATLKDDVREEVFGTDEGTTNKGKSVSGTH